MTYEYSINFNLTEITKLNGPKWTILNNWRTKLNQQIIRELKWTEPRKLNQ